MYTSTRANDAAARRNGPRRWRAPRRGGTLGLSLLLGACASLTTPPPPADWHARFEALDAIEHFSLDGRVAARGPVAGSARLDWTQHKERYALRLSGPFGAGAVLIEGGPDAAVVRHKDRILHTSDPEASLRAELGWTLPIASLRWWILGLPAPRAAATTLFDPQARLQFLRQHGWDVEYQEYRAADALSPVFDLPRRLQLRQGELSLRVVVDRWQAGAP